MSHTDNIITFLFHDLSERQKKSDWGLGLKALDETLGDSSQTLLFFYIFIYIHCQ